VIVGWQRARISLVGSVALIWLLIYLPVYLIATRQLRHIVATGARAVIDRRRSPRDMPTAVDAGAAPRVRVVTATEEPGERA